MKKLLFIIGFLCCVAGAQAFNEDDYRAYAKAMREQVWQMKGLPEFDTRQCPANLKGESAVILAAYDEVTVDQNKRLRSTGLNFYNVRQLTYNHIKRRLVAINDKQALDYYSQFDYQAFKKQHTFGIGDDVHCSALGVRVIKPDGTVREVSADEFVQNAEGEKGKEKREKLTVPGLQVGDMIDFFVATMEQLREENIPPIIISYINDYPTISYRVHIVTDKNLTTQYRTLNGAPDFTASTDDDDNIVLDAKVNNITATEPDLWYNPIRQTPSTILYITSKKIRTEWVPISVKDKGLQANPDANTIIKDDWDFWETVYAIQFKARGDEVKACRNNPALTTDEQKADFLYKALMQKHCSVSDQEHRFNNPASFIVELANWFKAVKIPFSRLTTTTTEAEPVDKLISYKDTQWLLKVGNHYYAFNQGPMGPGYIPANLQGQKAMMQADGKNFKQEAVALVLPQSTAQDNVASAAVSVMWDGTTAHIIRRNSISGAPKERFSFALPTTEQLTNEYADQMGHSFFRYGDDWTKKEKRSLEETIGKQKEQQKDIFKDEVNDFLGEDPLSVDSFSIGTLGINEPYAPMHYMVAYSQNGLVKKAGPNLILAIGKLIGDQLKIEGRDRKRTVDVVRTAPVTYSYQLNVQLPQGYKVSKDALAALNTSVSNAAGRFVSRASASGDIIVIKVEKVYNHYVEPVANWQQLLSIVDAAYNFTQKQIVVKR